MIKSSDIPANKWLRIMYNGEGLPDTPGYILSHKPDSTFRVMVSSPIGFVLRRAKATDPDTAHPASYRVDYTYRVLIEGDNPELDEPREIVGKWGFYADIIGFYQLPNKDLVINMVNLSYLRTGGGKYFTIVLPMKYVDMYEWLDGVG